MREIKMGAILSYLGILLTILTTLLYTPILTERLGQAEYGIYMLIGSVVSYLTILDMGLGNAIIRYISRERDNKEYSAKLVGMFLIMFTILGLILLLVGIVAAFNLNILFDKALSDEEITLGSTLLIILTINYTLSFPLSVFAAVIQAYEKFVYLKVLNIIRTVLPPIIIIPLLFLGYGSITVVLITTVVNILILILNTYYAFKKLNIKISFKPIQRSVLKEILIYSFFIFLVAIMDKIYWSTDQIILGMYSNINEVAVYALAMQFINLFMMLSTVISGLYLPKLSRMEATDATNEEFSSIFIEVGKIQTIILSYVIVGFILFGQLFIKLWVGEEYEDSFKITVIILIPLLLVWGQTIGIPILQAKNKHIVRSIIYLGVAILNIVISIPISQLYGGIGTAYITAIALFTSHIILMNIYYLFVIKLNIIRYWIEILRIYIIVSLVAILTYFGKIMIFYNEWLNLIVNVLLFTGIYFVVTYLFLLDKKVKTQIKSRLRR